VSRETVRSGENLQFAITITVLHSTALDVTVTDVLPPGVTFQSFVTGTPAGTVSGGTLTWWFASLEPGTHLLAYNVTVDDFLADGTLLTNRARLTHSTQPVPLEASATALVQGDYQVRVGVYNSAGELVREVLVGEFSQPLDSIDVETDAVIESLSDRTDFYYRGVLIGSWDGTSQYGTHVANGQYTVKIDNVDAYGVVTSLTAIVTVNRPLSQVSITVYNQAGEAVRHLYAQVADPQDLVTSVRLTTDRFQPSWGPAESGMPTEVGIVLSNGVGVAWDGRNDGGRFVEGGQYFVEVKASDGSGSEVAITREVTVLAAPQRAGTVAAVPNPVLAGQSGTRFRVFSGTALTVRAMVYDTAGELVRKVEGPQGAGEAWWDTRGVASGLYVAVVELLVPGGGVVDRQVKKVMVIRSPRSE
jgi:uncharacterized repeat protein (TIGR01451 family)